MAIVVTLEEDTCTLRFPSMDILAALRVAALQARRDGMPRCAERHEEQARALSLALTEYKSQNVAIQFD